MMEMGPYNTAKAAIISLSETLRWELAPDKIGVTVLCPMFFNTHLLDNMRYTDQFECDFAHSTFDHARMTADEVAAKAIKAVEKRKLYCVPQGMGKFFWGVKRISPSFFSGLMSLINRMPVARPIYMLLARLGLLQ